MGEEENAEECYKATTIITTTAQKQQQLYETARRKRELDIEYFNN